MKLINNNYRVLREFSETEFLVRDLNDNKQKLAIPLACFCFALRQNGMTARILKPITRRLSPPNKVYSRKN